MGQNEFSGKEFLRLKTDRVLPRFGMRTFIREGHQVGIEVKGEIATEMWREKEYDLCISTSGHRVWMASNYQHLEIECSGASNKFIFTTGEKLSSNIKIFLEETERAYLPKPFTLENLRAILKQIFVAS
jgi:CheY-like chemotaxis protein